MASIKCFLERGAKNLLVVEDNEIERQKIVDMIGLGDVRTKAVGSAAEALAALHEQSFDCMVLDLGLPDMAGFELLEKIKRETDLPQLRTIIYTAKDLSKEEEERLEEMAETIIVKDSRSLEHLLDKTGLFLHRVEAKLAGGMPHSSREVQKTDLVLTGKKVLIVDDDVRNIFALTSMLERWDMHVMRAENGREALEILQKTPDIDIVLMDIMMPEMDGYETMRAIREKAD